MLELSMFIYLLLIKYEKVDRLVPIYDNILNSVTLVF